MKYTALCMLVISLFSATQVASAAVSTEELLAQIQKLQAQLMELQKKPSESNNPPKAMQVAGNESPNVSFDRDLYLGMKNDADVQNLQEFLISKGYLSGSPTGNYFLLTVAAVKKFQSANGINPTGYFGPRMRGIVNKLIAQEMGEVCKLETGCDAMDKSIENDRPVAWTEQFYISPGTAEMKVGDTLALAALFQKNPKDCPSCGAGAPVKVSASWSSNDTNIAIVTANSSEALVRAIRPGKAIINAVYRHEGGKDMIATMPVSVSFSESSKAYITPSELKNAAVGSYYVVGFSTSEAPPGSGNAHLYSWTVSSGRLPAGLSLRQTYSATIIDGVPTSVGKETFTITARNSNHQLSKQYTLVVDAPPTVLKPSVSLIASSESKTGETISVNLGATIKFSAIPKNIEGLQYYYSAGTPPAGYYSREFVFGNGFNEINACVQNDDWVITCTAKAPGSSNIYVMIHTNDATYYSNKITVNLANTTSPSGVLSIIPFESTITAGESVNLGAFYTPSVPFCATCGAPVPMPVSATWTVSDPNIISVSNGLVRGLAQGEAKVYADYTLGSGEVVKAGAYVKVEPRVVVDPILPPQFSLTAVETVSAGNTFSVYWSNAADTTAKDWIAIVPRGATWAPGQSWAYTNGTASGVRDLTAPSAPGSYDVVYYKNNGYEEVKRIPITVLQGVALPILPPGASASQAQMAAMLLQMQSLLEAMSRNLR